MLSLDKLKASRVVWTANDASQSKASAHALNQPQLDSALQGGISPHGLLLFRAQTGCGELSFLLPAIKPLLQQQPYIALINPPGIPNIDWFSEQVCLEEHVFVVNAKDNAENLWAFEQCIMSGVCGVVVAWGLDGTAQQLRRCHLRAMQHQCHAVWFSDSAQKHSLSHTPCSAHLHLYQTQQQWYVDILKQQGGWPQADIEVEHPMPFNHQVINQLLHAPNLSTAMHT